MKKPKKVQAPEGCSIYLTPGKNYNVTGFWLDEATEDGYGFTINDDHIQELCCFEFCCAHLNGGNWIIIETE